LRVLAVGGRAGIVKMMIAVDYLDSGETILEYGKYILLLEKHIVSPFRCVAISWLSIIPKIAGDCTL